MFWKKKKKEIEVKFVQKKCDRCKVVGPVESENLCFDCTKLRLYSNKMSVIISDELFIKKCAQVFYDWDKQLTLTEYKELRDELILQILDNEKKAELDRQKENNKLFDAVRRDIKKRQGKKAR